MCFSFIIFSTCTKNNNDDEQEQNDVYNKVMKFKKGLSQKMLINTPTYILSKDDDDYHVDKSVILNRNCTHIDAVYTWVNGSDPNHIEKRKQAGFKVDTSEENRYRDFGALKYSLRSLHKYAPWINNIWIITDSQIPDFFDSEKESNIKFIFHESFFYNRSHLPTFNSVSIESNFYNLPEEVSNCFLYFNDDVFLKEPVEPTDFFYGEGEQYIFESLLKVGPDFYSKFNDLDNHMKSLILNGRLLDNVFKEKGVYRRNSEHGVQVFDRKILLKMQEHIGPELGLSSSHKVRDLKDLHLSFTYNQFAKKYQNGFKSKQTFNFYGGVGSNLSLLKKTLIDALRSPSKVVCLNDGLDSTNPQYEISIWEITNFFDILFPHPSPWEKQFPIQTDLPEVLKVL